MLTTIKVRAWNIDVLRDAAESYCYAHQDYMTFCKQYRSAKADGTLYANKHQWDAEYTRKNDADSAAWEKLRDMCALVGADFCAVLAVEKSIRRHAQYRCNWDFLPHWGASWMWQDEYTGSAGSEASYIKAVSAR